MKFSLPNIPAIDLSAWPIVRFVLSHTQKTATVAAPSSTLAQKDHPMPTVFQDISLAATVAFALPNFVSELKAVIPEATADVKALIADVVTPSESLIADIEVTVKGGNATAITADVQKSLADLIALFGALKAAIPAFKTDATGLYAELAPTAQSIASSVGISLPAAIFTTAPAKAATTAVPAA